jgi:hypothetical protein
MLIKKIAFLMLMIMPNVVWAHNDNNAVIVDGVEELPYPMIARMHAAEPIDFIGLAVLAAESRARYNKTSMSILANTSLSLEDRLQFALSLMPADKYKYARYKDMCLRHDLDIANGGKGIIGKINIQKDWSTTSLAKEMPIPFPEEFTPEIGVIHERLLELSAATDEWYYLALSLSAYLKQGHLQSPEFTITILKELYWAHLVEANTMQMMREKEGRDDLADGHTRDEVLQLQFIIDCVLLHIDLNLHQNESQIPLVPLLEAFLKSDKYTCIGYHLLSRDLSGEHSYKMGGANSILLLNELATSKSASIRESQTLTDLAKDLTKKGLLQDSHILRLTSISDNRPSPARIKPELIPYARQFFLNSECLTFDGFYKPILAAEKSVEQSMNEAKKDKIASSFLVGTVERKPNAHRGRKAQGKSKQGPKKPVQHVADVIDSPAPVASVVLEEKVPPVPNEVVPQAAVKKGLTKREKLQKKKLDKQEKLSQAVAERQEVAERNQQTQQHMVNSIQVHFEEAFTPSIEELEIYAKIWGPDSNRRDLCWADLRGQLKGFGWDVSNGAGGSYIDLIPPAWFGKVRVTADAALKINFRYARLMIHKPHLPALAPMPSYVVAFLREEFSGAIGLSEVVVNAMIRKRNEKG